MMSTGDRVVIVEPVPGGTDIRTFPTIKDMLTDSMMNRGAEMAMWAEIEAKRCADRWRAQLELEEQEMEALLNAPVRVDL